MGRGKRPSGSLVWEVGTLQLLSLSSFLGPLRHNWSGAGTGSNPHKRPERLACVTYRGSQCQLGNDGDYFWQRLCSTAGYETGSALCKGRVRG